MNPTAQRMLVKVPEVTVAFWVAKLATTAFGESFSDFVFFNDYLGQHLAIVLGLLLLLAALAVQMTRKRYVPWVYWSAVSAVSIFGTMSADFLNKDLGLSLTQSTIGLLVLQSTVFFAPPRCSTSAAAGASTTSRSASSSTPATRPAVPRAATGPPPCATSTTRSRSPEEVRRT